VPLQGRLGGPTVPADSSCRDPAAMVQLAAFCTPRQHHTQTEPSQAGTRWVLPCTSHVWYRHASCRRAVCRLAVLRRPLALLCLHGSCRRLLGPLLPLHLRLLFAWRRPRLLTIRPSTRRRCAITSSGACAPLVTGANTPMVRLICGHCLHAPRHRLQASKATVEWQLPRRLRRRHRCLCHPNL